MRIAPLSLLIYTSFFASTVFAQDTTTVNRIESEINAKQTEYTRSTTMLDKYLKEENQLQTQLELLRTRSTQLDKEKTQALDAMNDMYRRFIDNPSLYITSAQSRYQKNVF